MAMPGLRARWFGRPEGGSRGSIIKPGEELFGGAVDRLDHPLRKKVACPAPVRVATLTMQEAHFQQQADGRWKVLGEAPIAATIWPLEEPGLSRR